MTIWHSIVMPDCHGRPDWSARRVWSNNIDTLIDNVGLTGRAVGQSPSLARRPEEGDPSRGDGRHDVPAGRVEVRVVQLPLRHVPLYHDWIGTLDGLVNADIKAQVSGYLIQQAYKGTFFVLGGV
jgi:hypothetical protein